MAHWRGLAGGPAVWLVGPLKPSVSLAEGAHMSGVALIGETGDLSEDGRQGDQSQLLYLVCGGNRVLCHGSRAYGEAGRVVVAWFVVGPTDKPLGL